MKKIAPRIKNKKDKGISFTPLSATIRRKQKDPVFKKAFTEEMELMRLAHDIRNLREKNRMTQGEVARMAEMPRSVVARIESGTHNFSITTLYKVAQVFDKEIGLVG